MQKSYVRERERERECTRVRAGAPTKKRESQRRSGTPERRRTGDKFREKRFFGRERFIASSVRRSVEVDGELEGTGTTYTVRIHR